MRLTEEQKATIIRLVNDGASYNDIAVIVGCSAPSVSRIALKHGLVSQNVNHFDRLGGAEPVDFVQVPRSSARRIAEWIRKKSDYLGCGITIFESDGELRASLPDSRCVKIARRFGRVIGTFGESVSAEQLAELELTTRSRGADYPIEGS